MTTTPRLGITQLEEDQALPEAVVNEGVNILEMFATRLIVKSKGDNAPAGGEVNGDAYLVGSAGTGAFLGEDDKLALRINGAWEFITPKEGMEIEVEDEDTSYTLRGGTWVAGSAAAIEVLDEGVSKTSNLASMDFTGSAVTVTNTGDDVTVSISSGSIPSGTSFPGSPSSGDQFFRTDRQLIYTYDGTRWLSDQLFTAEMTCTDALLPLTATNNLRGVYPYAGTYDMYVVRGQISTFNTATTAANYFTAQFGYNDGASAFANLGSAISTQGNTQNAWVAQNVSINSVVTAAQADSLQCNLNETGAATLYIMGALVYRLVG